MAQVMKSLFVCGRCWIQIPEYDLQETDSVLYITFICGEKYQMRLDDYLTQLNEHSCIDKNQYCTLKPKTDTHNSKAVYYNPKTDHYMCEGCHANKMLNRNDIITTQLINIHLRCTKHCDRKLNKYCLKCKLKICKDCLNEHDEHKTQIKSFDELYSLLSELTVLRNASIHYDNLININKTVKEALLPSLSPIKKQMLEEEFNANTKNNELLKTLLEIIWYTYTIFKQCPHQTLLNKIYEIQFYDIVNNLRLIKEFDYYDLMNYFKHTFLITGITYQYRKIQEIKYKCDIHCVIQLSNKNIAVALDYGISIITNKTEYFRFAQSYYCFCIIEIFINDNNYLLLGTRNNVLIYSKPYEVENKEPLHILRIGKGEVICLLLIDHEHIMTGTDKNEIIVWKILKEINQWEVSLKFNSVYEPTSICLSNNDNVFIGTLKSFIMKSWNSNSNSIEYKTTSPIRSMTLYDEYKMITAEESGLIKIWNMPECQQQPHGEYSIDKGKYLFNILVNNETLLSCSNYSKIIWKIIEDNNLIKLIPLYQIQDYVEWGISFIRLTNKHFCISADNKVIKKWSLSEKNYMKS